MWMYLLMARENVLCVVTCVDLGFGADHDLTNDDVVAKLASLAQVGHFDGVRAGPLLQRAMKIRHQPISRFDN